MPPLQQLQQRNWLLHWSLFIFFNHSGGREALIDMYLQPQYAPSFVDFRRRKEYSMSVRYMSTIQTSCPHILRYLVAAVLTNRKRSKSLTNELVKLISQEVYQYQDPITEFITCLYVDFDFDRTQEVLKRCEEVYFCIFVGYTSVCSLVYRCWPTISSSCQWQMNSWTRRDWPCLRRTAKSTPRSTSQPFRPN